MKGQCRLGIERIYGLYMNGINYLLTAWVNTFKHEVGLPIMLNSACDTMLHLLKSTCQWIFPDLLGELLPGLLESVHGAVDEGSTDLEHAVVVVHAATDVCDGAPLLYTRHPFLHVLTVDDLIHHQAAHL